MQPYIPYHQLRQTFAMCANRQYTCAVMCQAVMSVLSCVLVAAGSELGVLKWRFQSRDDSLVPLSINCWPSASGHDSYVNIEYESQATFDLQNVVIAIPLPHMNHAPTIKQVCQIQLAQSGVA